MSAGQHEASEGNLKHPQCPCCRAEMRQKEIEKVNKIARKGECKRVRESRLETAILRERNLEREKGEKKREK